MQKHSNLSLLVQDRCDRSVRVCGKEERGEPRAGQLKNKSVPNFPTRAGDADQLQQLWREGLPAEALGAKLEQGMLADRNTRMVGRLVDRMKRKPDEIIFAALEAHRLPGEKGYELRRLQANEEIDAE